MINVPLREYAEKFKLELDEFFEIAVVGASGVFDFTKLPTDARDELIKRLEDNPNISDTERIISQFIKDIELKVDKQGNYQISQVKLIKIKHRRKRDIQEKIRNYEREELIKKLNAKAIVVYPRA